MRIVLVVIVIAIVIVLGVWIYGAGRQCTFRIPTAGPEEQVCWWSWQKFWR